MIYRNKKNNEEEKDINKKTDGQKIVINKLLPNKELRKTLGPCVSGASDAGGGAYQAMGIVCADISIESDKEVILFRDIAHTLHNFGKNTVLNCP